MINQFYIDYIKAIENPDRVGWNGKVWTAPQYKGYDKNQRGYGIDIIKNDSAKRLTQNRPGQWLTEGEADKLMKEHLLYVYGAALKHIKGFDNLSDRRKAALLGMLYRGDSVNKNKHIININEPDDNKFFESISNYYKSKGLNERARNSSNFFSNNQLQTKFLIPMKWELWEPPMKFKNGGQVRKMQTASGGPLVLSGKSQKEVDETNNYNRNKAKGLLKGIMSGKVLPTMSNISSMLGAAYSGWLDPETTNITGDVPNPGMRSPKLIISSVLTINKFKNILKNYNPYAYRKPKLPEIKISDKIIDDTKNLKIDINDLFTDNFIKYLEKQTGRKIKRIPYKNTKDGNIYKEGFSFVDENGKEIAHIAGNLKGKNVWVESSYVDPEFRHKGLGKLMYFDFNDNVYNTYGTTLHSSALQRVGYVDGGGMSPSNRLWKSLTDNKLATTEGSGFDWWNIMADPSKIKPAYRKQGGKMNILEFLQKGTSKNGITINKSVPEIIVVPNKLYLDTFYPVISNDYPMTGHSRIVGLAFTEDGFKEAEVDKLMDDAGYNLVTNNCADATKCVLENISGKKMNPYFFTTPGDVLSFFKKNFDVRKSTNSSFGNPVYYTNISEADFDKIKDLEQQLLAANKRMILKQFKQLTLNKKDGGKMNILEFLKNGSGIHIKEKNRGSFTRWCGGNVTEECIRRGKASSNPKIRKKATFADNARHFKHKEGGIIKALEGTKTNFFLKANNFLNSDLGKGLSNSLINGIGNIVSSAKATKAVNAQNEALDALLKAHKAKTFIEKYNENLQNLVDKSSIVRQSNAWNLASSLASSEDEFEKEINRQKLINEESARQALTDAWYTAASNIAGTAMNALSENGVPKTVSSPSYFDNYVNTLFKKSGTINSDGSMNLNLGTYKIGEGYKPKKLQTFNI